MGQKQGKDEKKKGDGSRKLYKVLIIGGGEQGKWTIWKQLTLWNKEYKGAHSEEIREILLKNIFEAITALCRKAPELGFSDAILPETREIIERFLSDEQKTLAKFPFFVPMIEKIWQDPGIQKTWENRHRFYHLVSTPYYMRRMRNWITDPITKEDYIFAKNRTGGVVSVDVEREEDELWRVCLVGGSRNQRKKWVHCFEETNVVLFVASAAEYNLTLYGEDNNLNRMQESLKLWEDALHSRLFSNLPLFLCLNQVDLFREKIEYHPLSVCFQEYADVGDIDKEVKCLGNILPNVLIQMVLSYCSPTADSALNYIKAQYGKRAKEKDRDVTVFETNATDCSTLEPLLQGIVKKLKAI